MAKNKKIVILGGGPAGIGAGWRLKELDYQNWELYEKEDFLGGLSASFKDKKGFIWDNGGHIYFSKSDYFNNVFNKIMAGDFFKKERRQFIWIENKLIPYPFQNHIRYLEPREIFECLKGMMEVQNSKKKPKNFLEFNLMTMGKGITKYFMRPYNEKIWSWPLEDLSYKWIGSRVSVVNLEKALENIVFKKDEVNWGPNYYFKYPKKGGAGYFWRGFEKILKNNLNFNKEIKKIDTGNKRIYFKDNPFDNYDYLISTLPLDFLVKNSDLGQTFKKSAQNLKYNSGMVIGVGIEGEIPESLKNKIALYFPEKKYFFHRMINMSYFSPNNVPAGNWAIAFEISYSSKRRLGKDEIVKNIFEYLKENKFIKNKKEIISFWLKDIEYFYPIPTLDRDKNLDKVQKELGRKNIYSVGRFGGWKYEIGNMNHSFLQGVEAVNKILSK